MKGMCAVCGKPANSPFVDPRFCHLCGLAFNLGFEEAAKRLVALVDPEPVTPCGCTTTLMDGTTPPAPTSRPEDYARGHTLGCRWAEWAIREINRRQRPPAKANHVDP